MNRIYMDYNATTPVREEAIVKCSQILKNTFGNASSMHHFGREAKVELEEARKKIAGALNASPEEIIFTSCGTESVNLAIRGVIESQIKKGNHVISSPVEHPAVLTTLLKLQKENRITLDLINVDKTGVADLNSLKTLIRKDTVLIAVMFANNETGVIQPVNDIGGIAAENGIAFLTDAVQAAGKTKIDVREINCSLLAASGHKFYAPKGVGFLYLKKGTRLKPIMTGGHHEKNLRPGTENIAFIAAMAEALSLSQNELDGYNEKLQKLTLSLYEGITASIKDVFINGDINNRINNTLNLSFKGIEGEAIMLNLDLQGIAVSTGSACSSGSLEPSHVLKAMGTDIVLAQGSIRFSLGRRSAQEDVDKVIEVLPPIIDKLRKMSPLY